MVLASKLYVFGQRKIPKNPERFKTIPGLEIDANPYPENPGIPGFLQNPVPKIPGLKLLIPLGPDDRTYWFDSNSVHNILSLDFEW